ncbi:HAD-IIB family hydrolase [Dialister micraerophilus]|uniref:HAD hydrolase, family IIB n=1 Tax=Dialister micraerophilus UPII 345-E TaxID=910314 RepID=E4L9Z8_9FIRM|nr:HAD-IIB family hydrolase [Dialister micraerophilus]EFR42445.1 HAD hydrolase, family IIB [Dialister micraerophilus UPII 345-E]
MKKFFFFDIDGTLRSRVHDNYSDSTLEALHLLRKNGHFVALATGRIQDDAKDLAKELDVESFISDGGNALTVNGELIYHDGLPIDTCHKFLNGLDPEKYPAAVVIDNARERHANSLLYKKVVPDEYYKTFTDTSLDFNDLDKIYKIFLGVSSGDRFSIDFHGLTYFWYEDDTMLIEPVNKERGIFEMMKRYGVNDDQIVVFGDGKNDEAMFRPEWMSVAMGNSHQKLKNLSKYVTDSVDDDGIYNACKKFGWI